MSADELWSELAIDRSSTTDRVAAALRRALFDGLLAAGTPLRELDLARRLGVSRGTLREALRVLEAEGLLVREPNRGVVVKLLSAEDLTDLHKARQVIEVGAVAARLPGRIGALRSALARYAQALAGTDEQAVADAHIGFHVEVVALSGNRRLTQAAAALLAEARLALAAADRRQHDSAEQLTSHSQLVEALGKADLAVGVAAVREHLADALEPLVEARLASVTVANRPPAATDSDPDAVGGLSG